MSAASRSLAHRTSPPSLSSTLRRSGLEIVVPPNRPLSSGRSPGALSKELPPLPTEEISLKKIPGRPPRDIDTDRRVLKQSKSCDFGRHISSPASDYSTHSLPKSLVQQPNSKSANRITRLPGPDSPTIPGQEQSSPHTSSSSSRSGSVYSRPEHSPIEEDVSHFSSWGSAPTEGSQNKETDMPASLEKPDTEEPTPNIPSSTTTKRNQRPPPLLPIQPPPKSPRRPPTRRQTSDESIRSLPDQDRLPKTLQNGRVITLAESNPDLRQKTTLRELLEEEQWKVEQGKPDLYSQFHGRKFSNLELDTTVPDPLRLRKAKSEARLRKRPTLLASVRENFVAGMSDLASPIRSRHSRKPSSAVTTPRDSSYPITPNTPRARFDVPSDDEEENSVSQGQGKRAMPSSGNHPLKSPFPFSSFVDTSDESEDGSPRSSLPMGRKLSKRISGVMRRASSSALRRASNSALRRPSNGALRTKFVRTDERVANGPDTAMTEKSMKGFEEHFQEAFATAKRGLTIKTAEKRKRDNLKKKIVVIGITDQNPDGRLSEWV